MLRETIVVTYKTARRVVVAVVGASVVIIGLTLLVLPGPAFVVIPAGLAILGLEFAFARRWLVTIKEKAQSAVGRAANAQPPSSDAASTAESSPADRPAP